MTKTSRILIIITAALTAFGSQAAAQTSPNPPSLAFVNVNYAYQTPTRSIEKSASLPVFGETATVTSSQAIRNGALFDVSGGYRVWRNLAVAVGYSSFSKPSDASVVGKIPNPLVFDQPATVTTTQAGLAHKENAIYLQVLWFVPVNDKIDVAFSVGPSFIKVTQELVSGFSIPAGTQNLNVTVGSEEATAKGINAGVDGNYLFTRHIGLGLLLRYNGATVDLPSAPGLKVGGFQVGIGIRARF